MKTEKGSKAREESNRKLIQHLRLLSAMKAQARATLNKEEA